MNGGGPGSGIWKSTDGGETWTRLKGNGIPDGPLGRIALDVYRKRPNILYALIEGPTAAGRRPWRSGAGGGGAASGAEEGAGAPAAGAGGRRRSAGAAAAAPEHRSRPVSTAPTTPARPGGR